jgi:hypothetical protein
MLNELAREKEWQIQEAVADNFNTLPATLTWLARNSRYFVVLGIVAGNVHTPPGVLSRLSREESWEVKYHVATNSNTPKGALINLARDVNRQVQHAVALHKRTPRAIRFMLFLEHPEWVK